MMRLSGILWMWREKPPGDADASGLSYRPTPRKPWHWLVLFSPSLGLLLHWLVMRFLPFTFPLIVYELIEIARPLAFLLGCFSLGIWWRRRWVGDRFGHSIMAGLAVLAFNIGAMVAVPFVLVVAANLFAHLFR